MSRSVLHISHTDIRTDSRILKEMGSLHDFYPSGSVNVFGIGLEEFDNGSSDHSRREGPLIIYAVKRKLSGYLKGISILKHGVSFFELFLFIFIESFRIKPSVVHCHDTLVLPIGLFIKIFFRSKLVYDAHELESNKNLQTALNSRITRIIEKCCWWGVDLFITVSPSINDWYQSEFGEKFSVTVLNSPLVSSVRGSINGLLNIRQKFGIADDEKVFVYLGILATGRGIEQALDVFCDDRVDAHLIFVGWGPLEEKIAEYGSRNAKIHSHPPVKHAEVVGFIRECDFGICMIENVSLSDYLCLPNKLFEYCFAGLPVLASDFPELSRVVEKHDLGVVCDGSHEQMVGAISQLMGRSEGFSFLDIDTLGWEKQAQQLWSAYSRLLPLNTSL